MVWNAASPCKVSVPTSQRPAMRSTPWTANFTEGLQGYVRSFDAVVDDCSAYFKSICERTENKMKQRFLLDESMGGVMALLIHRKNPDYWNGAVLVARKGENEGGK